MGYRLCVTQPTHCKSQRAQDRIRTKFPNFQNSTLRPMFKTVHICQFLSKFIGRNARNSFESFKNEVSSRIFKKGHRKFEKLRSIPIMLLIFLIFLFFRNMIGIERSFSNFLCLFSKIRNDTSFLNNSKEFLAFLPMNLNKN